MSSDGGNKLQNTVPVFLQMFIKCRQREKYLFLISSRISGPDGPVGFEPEISRNEHQHCLFIQQGKVYIKTNPLIETSESGPLFYGKDFGLKRQKKRKKRMDFCRFFMSRTI